MDLITQIFGRRQPTLKFYYFDICCKSSVPFPCASLLLFFLTLSIQLPFKTDYFHALYFLTTIPYYWDSLQTLFQFSHFSATILFKVTASCVSMPLSL